MLHTFNIRQTVRYLFKHKNWKYVVYLRPFNMGNNKIKKVDLNSLCPPFNVLSVNL